MDNKQNIAQFSSKRLNRLRVLLSVETFYLKRDQNRSCSFPLSHNFVIPTLTRTRKTISASPVSSPYVVSSQRPKHLFYGAIYIRLSHFPFLLLKEGLPTYTYIYTYLQDVPSYDFSHIILSHTFPHLPFLIHFVILITYLFTFFPSILFTWSRCHKHFLEQGSGGGGSIGRAVHGSNLVMYYELY